MHMTKQTQGEMLKGLPVSSSPAGPTAHGPSSFPAEACQLETHALGNADCVWALTGAGSYSCQTFAMSSVRGADGKVRICCHNLLNLKVVVSMIQHARHPFRSTQKDTLRLMLAMPTTESERHMIVAKAMVCTVGPVMHCLGVAPPA